MVPQLRICLQYRRCRRLGFDSWVKKIPWNRNWQDFSLENSMDRGAWQGTVYGVAKSWNTTEQFSIHAQRM